jgi:S-formylglutathione hydrolase FrmB
LVLALTVVSATFAVGGSTRGSMLSPDDVPAFSVPVAAPMLSMTGAAVTPTQLLPGQGKWSTLTAASHELGAGATREVLVYTPPVAHPNSLPVVYFLHGTPGNDSDLCNPAASDALLKAFRSGSQPFILACPDGNPAAQDDSEWADSADGRTMLESFVTTSVIRAVEGTNRRSRGTRALAGFSMGGFGAAAIALRHPELYGQVGALAGYFHLDDPDSVFGSNPSQQAAHNPTALVTEATAIRWSLTEAAADELPLTAHDSERYAGLLKASAASVQLRVVPGTHAPAWAVSQLPQLANFFSAGWTKA